MAKNVPGAALGECLQSMRLEVRGAHSKGRDGTLILMLTTRVRGDFPAEQTPEAQELEVSESFWGTQVPAEDIGWTRFL